MQPRVRRFLLARLCPVLSDLVLGGLLLVALAALVLAGPAIAGEVTTGVPAAPWQRLTADSGDIGPSQYPIDFPGLTGSDFFLRKADDGGLWRGFFFGAGGGLRIGAQGSFDPGSGNLRAMIALKLDF